MNLYNKIGKEELRKRLEKENFRRITVSFYRYVKLFNIEIFRNNLYLDFDSLNIFGRVYLAHEGINAQISVPEHSWNKFKKTIFENLKLRDVPLKIAVEDDGKSFYKLIVRIKTKIVSDGLNDGAYDVTNVGKHLTAKEFNEALNNPETIVIDMRNHYESEVGKFENALCLMRIHFVMLYQNQWSWQKAKRTIKFFCIVRAVYVVRKQAHILNTKDLRM
jgi:UPF0176 protein